jgi:hypothetical protein
LIDRVTERRLGADRIGLVRTRSRISRRNFRTNHMRSIDGREAASLDAGLSHRALVKRSALRLLFANALIITQGRKPLSLVDLVFPHTTAPTRLKWNTSKVYHILRFGPMPMLYLVRLMPWKRRTLEPAERENDQLRMVVIQLRHELQTKQTALSGLELALRERSERIDALQGRLEQSRAQCRRLDEECENYFRMLQAG